MKVYCSIMYKKMQEELLRCKRSTACFEMVEASFQVAYRYWNRVKEKLSGYNFKNDQTEILFFKKFKPKFTSEIEYYELLYHAAVFEPSTHKDAILFWNREFARFQKFETENKSFLRCYFDQECHLIPYYFLRRYSLNGNGRTKLYDAGTKLTTNGDYLVATFLALQRYRKYVSKKQAGLIKWK